MEPNDVDIVDLPDTAQSVYEHAYLSALGTFGKDEGSAARAGWRAVQQFYERSRSGNWVHK